MKTDLIFILDRSGSMSGLEADTIGGFNSMLAKQKKEEGEATVTTVFFDHEYEIIHDRFKIEQVKPLTDDDYYVRGSTALLDAVGSTINKEINVQKRLPEGDRADKVICVIITDGMENASREYSYNDVSKMIQREKDKHGWEFIFLGANIDAAAEAARMGISSSRAATFCNDSAGTALNYDCVCEAVSMMRCDAMPQEDTSWKERIESDFKRRGRRR